MKKAWFGLKQSGWVVSPSSWEGWTATAVILVVMGVSIRMFGPALHDKTGWPMPLATFAISMTGLAVLLVVVALTYGQRNDLALNER
jgi:uncharacterized membrane protein YidH (DUF202 family)